MTDYIFEFSPLMKEYRKDNSVNTRVIDIHLKNKRQLSNRHPKFIMTFLIPEDNEQFIWEVATNRVAGIFQVRQGYGQAASGIIKEV